MTEAQYRQVCSIFGRKLTEEELRNMNMSPVNGKWDDDLADDLNSYRQDMLKQPISTNQAELEIKQLRQRNLLDIYRWQTIFSRSELLNASQEEINRARLNAIANLRLSIHCLEGSRIVKTESISRHYELLENLIAQQGGDK